VVGSYSELCSTTCHFRSAGSTVANVPEVDNLVMERELGNLVYVVKWAEEVELVSVVKPANGSVVSALRSTILFTFLVNLYSYSYCGIYRGHKFPGGDQDRLSNPPAGGTPNRRPVPSVSVDPRSHLSLVIANVYETP